ncbi:hypothetical protein J0X19_07980 [Hymenobacter sp. BT186]|uniref:DUF3108 domain-containing protein n=1 Tax=Hymenobacter telluris TaxID=2816474 RepID=A0A939J8L5_9BACT|nr:DUF5991 domain-containing protein [Hymenobacter telluris]MBO0357879.1 hypothetical protein [Hymenobacter telluris]MBW3373906.1 hypothetical protein [Hymenobacter norwichensis]
MMTLLVRPLLWSVLAFAAPAATGLPSWVGTYQYEEKPVKALAGYSMSMLWKLTLQPQDSKALGGLLSVEGQQTYMKLKVRATGSAQDAQISFLQLVDGNDYQQFKPGDVLLRLRKDSKGVTRTYWGKLQPRLSETYKDGQVSFVRK